MNWPGALVCVSLAYKLFLNLLLNDKHRFSVGLEHFKQLLLTERKYLYIFCLIKCLTKCTAQVHSVMSVITP